MALPKQVREREAALKRLEEELATPQEEAAPAEQPTEATSDDSGQTEPQAEPQATTTQPPEEQPREQDDADEDKWEHKYRRLQGKYDAEVPRLHSEVKELKSLIAELQAQTQQPKEPEPTPEKAEPLVTDKDVEAFGDDLIDLQRRVAREVAAEFQQELSKLREENQKLKDQFGTVQTSTFETRLLQAVPDFSEINQDKRWIAWLNEYDPMLRAPRRQVAEAAYQNGDVEGVKAYVELFKQTLQPQPTQADRQAELQRQVQPTRASAPTAAQPQAKVYTPGEADQVAGRIRQLIAAGKLSEAAKLETEISTAWAEGRVTA